MSKTFDLSTLNLSAGTHEITVKARASGYADSPASNAVSYVVAGDTVQVSGTWYFNEPTSRPISRLTQSVKFSSNGIMYSYIEVSDDKTSGSPIWYDSVVVYSYGGIEPEPIQGWQDEAYRTITFDGKQTVSKEFYEWLVANAVQQTIGFTIDGTTYYAKEGMTWGEWLSSEYNTGDFNLNTYYIMFGYTNYFVCDANKDLVMEDQQIIAGYSYGKTYVSGPLPT